jgi:hypothetical protein
MEQVALQLARQLERVHMPTQICSNQIKPFVVTVLNTALALGSRNLMLQSALSLALEMS